MKSTKYFGIIGGMGAKATSEFFERIIKNTTAGKDKDHLNV